jgi:hypothetical protein
MAVQGVGAEDDKTWYETEVRGWYPLLLPSKPRKKGVGGQFRIHSDRTEVGSGANVSGWPLAIHAESMSDCRSGISKQLAIRSLYLANLLWFER